MTQPEPRSLGLLANTLTIILMDRYIYIYIYIYILFKKNNETGHIGL